MNRAAFILLAVILPAAIHSYLIYQQQNKPVPKPEPMGVCYLIWQESNGETRRVSAKAKLTEEDVVAIRKSKKPSAHLARELGVSKAAVGHARTGITWGHIK